VVVRVRVAGEDDIDAGAGHLPEGVLGQAGGAGVVEGAGEGPGESDPLVELAGGEQPGVARELTGRWRDGKRSTEEVEAWWSASCYTHPMSPGQKARPFGSPGETRAGQRFCDPLRELAITSRRDLRASLCRR
jgi:hypothetical protein